LNFLSVVGYGRAKDGNQSFYFFLGRAF